ncbi:hypothetical protein SUGI_0685780 [Cryptomeria japonica]|nr:hypothetical protein SUGI_0685780 [Cryptomeria japonica]
MRRRPDLLRNKSDHTAREAIHLLKDSGFTDNQLKNTIVNDPSIILLTVDGQLKPKMEVLKNLGLTPGIISHTPRLLSFSLENTLGPRIAHLRNVFGSNVHLCQALKTVPELLTNDFEKKVKPKMEYVKNNIGILEGSTTFLRVLNAVLGHSFETLDKKIKHMASLGLAEEEILPIIKSNPRVLRISTKKVKENMDFLIHTAGLMPSIVASSPILLNYSVEKRLKPRYELFKYLRTKQQSKRLPNLASFLKLRPGTCLGQDRNQPWFSFSLVQSKLISSDLLY